MRENVTERTEQQGSLVSAHKGNSSLISRKEEVLVLNCSYFTRQIQGSWQ